MTFLDNNEIAALLSTLTGDYRLIARMPEHWRQVGRGQHAAAGANGQRPDHVS